MFSSHCRSSQHYFSTRILHIWMLLFWWWVMLEFMPNSSTLVSCDHKTFSKFDAGSFGAFVQTSYCTPSWTFEKCISSCYPPIQARCVQHLFLCWPWNPVGFSMLPFWNQKFSFFFFFADCGWCLAQYSRVPSKPGKSFYIKHLMCNFPQHCHIVVLWGLWSPCWCGSALDNWRAIVNSCFYSSYGVTCCDYT